MGPRLLFLESYKSSYSQGSLNLKTDSICILKWTKPIGLSLQIWTLQGRVVEEIGGTMELRPQLWSSTLCPRAPGASGLYDFPLDG